MDFYPFPALLQSVYNDIYEYGRASVVAGDDAIDFEGDFVPLVPLGTAAEISWIMADRRVARYTGRAYLSSPTLLRITGVPHDAVKELRGLFASNTRLPAQVAVPPSGKRAKKNTSNALPHTPVQIIYLSPQVLTLRAPLAHRAGSHLLLFCEVDFLTLRALSITVRRQTTLRKQDILLHCSIENPSQENLISLSAYSARLEQLADEDAEG